MMFKRKPWALAVLLAAPVGLTVPATAGPVISDRNVPVEQGARRETLLEGLEHPWSMAWLPDGAMLVTERPGRLRLVRNGMLVPEPVAGVPPVFAENQGGLLDVSLHPDFATNRLIYLTLADGSREANRARLVRGTLSPDGTRIDGARTVFEVSQTKPGGQHFGSRIAWMPDKTLLLSIGDGGNPPTMLDGRFIRENAQSLQSHLGKIVQLRDDGTPVPNPALAAGGALPGIFSYGHRNIQGIVFDRARNSVWATEHGALGGDEVNRITRGGNFGWPLVSMTREYVGGKPVGSATTAAGKIDPVLLWEVSTAPSGLALYDANAFPQWRGDLFSGSLVSLDVRRLDLDAGGAIVGETALRVGQRVRDVRVGPDGFLYVLTDEKAGRLLRFVPSQGGQSAPAALTRPGG